VVGFGGTAIGMLLGGLPGMYSAYRRGRVDTVLDTISYAVLAFPALVAVIAIGEFWGHQLWKITLVIGVFSAPLIFRVIRASTLSYATRDFVMAAKALGASDRRILARELFPNIVPTIISFGLIAVASIVVLEGTLAFLGLSVPLPTPSWGNMLNEGSTLLSGSKGQTNPWLVIFPAVAMFSLLFTLNVVADKLRAHFDVSEVKL
jgi:peptide/nickel transport system permease protein